MFLRADGFDAREMGGYSQGMNPKRATVYFEPELHRVLSQKAALSDRSISQLVNEAVRIALAEDAEDLERRLSLTRWQKWLP